jgi:hypothetical protein
MADETLSRDELHEGHPGGGRFNQLLLIVIVTAAMIAGVVAALGIHSAGVPKLNVSSPLVDESADAARNKAEVEDLAAGHTAGAAHNYKQFAEGALAT